jgi:hypothetical protein
MKNRITQKIYDIDIRAKRSHDGVTISHKDFWFLTQVIGKLVESDFTDYDLTLVDEIEDIFKILGE